MQARDVLLCSMGAKNARLKIRELHKVAASKIHPYAGITRVRFKGYYLSLCRRLIKTVGQSTPATKYTGKTPQWHCWFATTQK